MPVTAAEATAIIAKGSNSTSAEGLGIRGGRMAYISLPDLAEALDMPELIPMIESQSSTGGLKLLNALFVENQKYFLVYDAPTREIGFDYERIHRLIREAPIPEIPLITREQALTILANLSTEPIRETNYSEGLYPGYYASVPLTKMAEILGTEPDSFIDIKNKLGGPNGFSRGCHANDADKTKRTVEVYTDRLKALIIGKDWKIGVSGR